MAEKKRTWSSASHELETRREREEYSTFRRSLEHLGVLCRLVIRGRDRPGSCVLAGALVGALVGAFADYELQFGVFSEAVGDGLFEHAAEAALDVLFGEGMGDGNG